jgi:hypothetical protein
MEDPMKNITINLKVPEELNQERQKLKCTWRELIETGIAAKKDLNGEIHVHLQTATQSLVKVLKLVKK